MFQMWLFIIYPTEKAKWLLSIDRSHLAFSKSGHIAKSWYSISTWC